MSIEKERADFEDWAKGRYILKRSAKNEYMSVPTILAWEVWQARANIDSLRFRDEPVRCAVCGTHEVSAAVTCQNSSCPVYVNALRAHKETK
jgi:hypothetical protein